MSEISFDQIAKLLPKPTDPNDEAWEFRFLFSNDGVRDAIFIEGSPDGKTLRATFPVFDGRGRIWLKRSWFNDINEADVLAFNAIINSLESILRLPVLYGKFAQKCTEIGN
jgi:hypothetical protein